MWNYIKTNKIVLISSILVIILFIFLLIQWFDSRKIRNKITHMDKQIYSLGKSQVYLEKTMKKLLRVKPPSSTPIILEQSPKQLQVILEPPSPKVDTVPEEPKIIEIDDSESDSESEIDKNFDDKTLDLELENELKELKA